MICGDCDIHFTFNSFHLIPADDKLYESNPDAMEYYIFNLHSTKKFHGYFA